MNSAQVGTEQGQYPPQAVAELSSAIAAAQAVYDNQTAYQYDTNLAMSELEEALPIFPSKVNTADEENKLKVDDARFHLHTQEGMVDLTNSGLTEGTITAQISLTNNIQGEAATVRMLIALHSGGEAGKKLKGVWIDSETIKESSKTEVLTKSFDITGLGENDKLTVYFWNGADNIKPLRKQIVFFKEGILE